jgi:hypothetical protein
VIPFTGPDFGHGDEVIALTLKDRRIVRGMLNGMSFGYTAFGGHAEKLLEANVYVPRTKRNYSVRPSSLRLATDKNGFNFAVNHATGSITLRRNDAKMLSAKWMKKTGVRKLMQSMEKIK